MAKRMDASDINAYYGNFQALKDVNLNIEPNDVTALIGPSGCGKSTFLRCLNRMHEAIPKARVEGKLLLDGEDIYAKNVDISSLRRDVGMVFQKPNPFPTMSVKQNVLSGLKLTGRLKKSDANEITEHSLKRAGLWEEVKDRLDRPGGSLSGGQQQRLCIARTIAVKPDVVLMDEPASALDPISTLKIEDLIGELKRDYTIVIVTHNMQQAARISSTTAFFNLDKAGDPGHLVEVGPTEKIFTNPDNPRTAEYVEGRFG